MRSKVHEKLERPFSCLSVCLSHQSTAAAAFDGFFFAEHLAGRGCQSISSGAGAAYQLQARRAAGVGAQQQTRAVSCSLQCFDAVGLAAGRVYGL